MSIIKNKKLIYCPGCGHNTIKNIIAEIIDDLDLQDDLILMTSPGCSIILYRYFDCDIVECAHGRASAVATGIKKALPDKLVVSYQGDGDLASIGMGEIIHAASRGDNLSIIFVNNAIYSMTGGQAAPTTIPGQKTTTTPGGSNAVPIKVCELLSGFDNVKYLERCCVDSSENIKKTKDAIKKSFLNQINRKGFSLIEIISPCPTGWRMKTKEAFDFTKKMTEYFPIGVIKDELDKSKLNKGRI